MQECGKEQAKVAEERKRYREFTVTPGLCGFKVRIGCSELYFSGAGALAAEIRNYLDDPEETTRKFQNGDIRFSGGGPGMGLMAPEPTGPSHHNMMNQIGER